MAYDDYKNTSTLSWTSAGRLIRRARYIRGDTELDVAADPLCPQRGDVIPVIFGSILLENLYCQEVTIKAVEAASGDGAGMFLWEVDATYKPLTWDNPTANKARWSISFRPQQYMRRFVDEDIQQDHYGPSGSAALQWPPVTTGINVTADGPQGVSVDEMVEVLSLEFWKSPSDVEAFLDVARALKDTTNDAEFTGPWGTYQIGEARITGITVGHVSGELASISVEVSRQPNKNNIEVYLDSIEPDGGMVTLSKLGWEYLWVRYLKTTNKDSLEQRPLAIDAHVATIYEPGDYSTLGVTDGIFI